MPRYAIVKDEIVENVILWDGEEEWNPPEGRSLVQLEDEPVGVGWKYIGGEWIPPEPEPQEDF